MTTTERLPDVLAATVRAHGDRVAVVDGTLRWTWRELAAHVAARADVLRRNGADPGASVALVLPNGVGFVVDFLAITTLGATAIPLNPQLTLEELNGHTRGCDVRGVIVEVDRADDGAALAAAQQEAAWSTHVYNSDARIDGSRVYAAGDFDPATRALIGFSSGSTGRPKPIPRTHANLTVESAQFTTTVAMAATDVVLAVVPLHHAHGLGNALLASVRSGATMVLLDHFARGPTLTALTGERVTVFPAIPFMLDVLADAARRGPTDLTSLRLCFTAGASLPEEVFDRFLDATGIAARQLYGCSEAGSVTINLDDPRAIPTTVGRALRGVELQVIDAAGRPVEPVATGEIAFRSSALAGGYLGDGEATARSFRDGWFLTGDLGHLDDAGRLYVTGRTKLYISTGGHKVDPSEVENVIAEHPSVREVVVVGVAEPRGGEAVKAVVVADDPMERADIVAVCRDRIAEFKIPRIIEFVDSIPRSPLGKILRKDLVDPPRR